MKNKVKNKKGFTLAELLVVIAILAILVAVAVPIFTSQLSKAHESVKEANLRAAQVAAMVKYLDEGETGPKKYHYEVDENKNIVLTDGSSEDIGPSDENDTSGCVQVGE